MRTDGTQRIGAAADGRDPLARVRSTSSRGSGPTASWSPRATSARRKPASRRRSAAAAATTPPRSSAAALRATECQIWTDVEGVLTADPRIVEEALPIPELSFAEAAELAAFGAKVLHPATIQPAIEGKVPVTVRHTRRPEGRFTTITGQRPQPAGPSPRSRRAARSPCSP